MTVRSSIERIASPLAGVVALVLPVLAYRRTEEDAYISLRMAENLAQGHGYSFDRYRPESAASNPLFVALVSGGRALGFPSEDVALGLQVLFVAVTALAVVSFIPRTEKSAARLWLAVLFGLLLAFSPYGYWALSGLENALMALLLLGMIWSVSESRHGLAVLLGLLAAFTRLEGIAYLAICAGVIVANLWLQGARREARWFLLRCVLPCFVIWAASLWLHDQQFGRPFPNSFYLKGHVPLADMGQGAIYLAKAGAAAPPVAILMGLVWLSLFARRRIALRPHTCLALAFVLFGSAVAWRAGGDYLPYYRLVSWLLPCVIALLACDLFPRYRRVRAGLVALLVLVTVAAALPSARRLVNHREGWVRELASRVEAGRAFDQLQTGRYTLALVAHGAFGFGAPRATILDPLILGSSEAIDGKLVDPAATAGHRFYNASFLEARRPDYIVVHPGASQETSAEILDEVRERSEGRRLGRNAPAITQRIARMISSCYDLKSLPLDSGALHFFKRRCE